MPLPTPNNPPEEIRAVMTPAEIQKALDALKSEFLPESAWMGAVVSFGEAFVYANPAGPAGHESIHGKSKDWPEALENMRAALIVWSEKRVSELVRKMALSIIDLTDSGICDLDALIKSGFKSDEIARSGAAACELAAKMTSVEAYHIHSSKAAAE